MSIAPSNFLGSAVVRKRSVAEIGLVTVALLAAASRVAEVPRHPIALVRVALSLGAAAFLLFGPGASFGRRAVLVIAIEAVIGFAMFAAVDVPFIMDHQRQIGIVAVSIAEDIERVERAERLRDAPSTVR